MMSNENLETSDASEHASSQVAGPERLQAVEEGTKIAQYDIGQMFMFNELTVRSEQNALVATFKKERYTNEDAIMRAGADLLALLKQQGAAKGIVIDLQGVESIAPAMYGKLVIFYKKAKELQVPIRFCSTSARVMNGFKITRLNMVFSISEDRTQALASFAAES